MTHRARREALNTVGPRVERANGMEAWFALSARRVVSPPPKWKMAIVSMMALYPLILLIQPALAPLSRGAPRWLATLMTMFVITPLMTWLALPLIIRLLRPWLYPGGSLSDAVMSEPGQ